MGVQILVSENVIDTESGIRRCNAELARLDKDRERLEELMQSNPDEILTIMKMITANSNAKTFWSKELQGYLRLAEQQGKGKKQASALVTTPKKRVKIPQGVEINSNETVDNPTAQSENAEG